MLRDYTDISKNALSNIVPFAIEQYKCKLVLIGDFWLCLKFKRIFEFDFETDCIKAIDLLGGKIIAYPKYCEDFKTAVLNANTKKGLEDLGVGKDIDILHYLNWETPRLWLNSEKFESVLSILIDKIH